jgi:branched-chain amino acid transport system permease protein
LIIAPIAVRLKGLNLALVTLAFVFICSHIFSNFISVTGGAGIGRKVAKLELFGVNLEEGLVLGNFLLDKNQIIFICLFLCVFTGIGFKNLVRSRAGRAYAAIRDGDIAAEALGVNLFRYKATAFALASFYAGSWWRYGFTISGGVEPGLV